MDVREKLVELLKKAKEKEQYDFLFGDIDTAIDMPHGAEYYADFLIANGVTVQDNTEISEELLKQLRNAPVTILQEEPTIEVVQEWISVKDRLPTEEAKAYEKEWEDYPVYIVMIDRGYLPTTLYYDCENNEWFKINTALKREKYKVTYWMEMPQPPKGE